MSKKIDVSAAADWSKAETEFNLNYLRSRGQFKQAEEVERIREGGESPPDDDELNFEEATVDDVLEWVDEDADRARIAYQKESSRDKPRTTLLSELEEVMEEDEEDEEDE